MHSTDHGFRWVPPCKDSMFVPSFPSLREELMRQHRQSNTNIFRCDAWRLAPISGTQMGIRLNFWNRNLVDHLIKCLSHHCLSRARKVGSSCLKESRVEMLTWSVFTCKSIARGPGNYVIVPDFRMWRTQICPDQSAGRQKRGTPYAPNRKNQDLGHGLVYKYIVPGQAAGGNNWR